MQGLLHISDLGSDYFRYDRRNQCLYGERNGKRFTLGEQREVTVVNVEPPQGKIELRLKQNPGGGDDRRKGKSRRKNSPERSDQKSLERTETENNSEATAADANDPWAASKRKIKSKAEAVALDAVNPATESSPNKKTKKKKKGKSNAELGKKKLKKKIRAKPRSKFADKS